MVRRVGHLFDMAKAISRYLSVPVVAHVVDMVEVGRKLVEGLVGRIEDHSRATKLIVGGSVMRCGGA